MKTETKIQTPAQWIEDYNNQGKVMITLPDLFGTNKSFIKCVRESCTQCWVPTSTVTTFENNLSGKVSQNYGSKIVTSKNSSIDLIPVLEEVPLNQIVKDEEALKYVGLLMGNANAKPEYLFDMFLRFMKIIPEKILVSTSTEEERKIRPSRVAGIYLEKDILHLNCNGSFSGKGISYGYYPKKK